MTNRKQLSPLEQATADKSAAIELAATLMNQLAEARGRLARIGKVVDSHIGTSSVRPDPKDPVGVMKAVHATAGRRLAL